MSFRLVCVASLVIAVFTTAFCLKTGNKVSASNVIRKPPTRQDEFDGMPLPENSEVPTATQITPAVVKIGQRYGVPHLSGKKKQNLVKKTDHAADHALHGASLLSSTALMSLGALALIVTAGKALLLALAAIAITCLAASGPSAEASAVFEVVAKPHYSPEAHREPHPPAPLADYGYGGYAPP